MPSPQDAANEAPEQLEARAPEAPAGAAAETPAADHVEWLEAGITHRALWRSQGGWPAPQTVQIVDERMGANAALALLREGTALLWRGDYNAAKQLLSALGKRLDRAPKRKQASITEAFHQHRSNSFERARMLGLLLIELDAHYALDLRRAPDVGTACAEAYGPPPTESSLVSLRELIGVIGAHEWRQRGVPIAVLGGDRIHPHYGVFSPVRGEYLELVATAPLPPGAEAGRAFDIGTGTGVLATILARRGIRSIIASDQDPRALACARENLDRLGVADAVDLQEIDLFPLGRAELIVCNPPWLPAPARVGTDHAVYDPDSRMLRGFLAGLPLHLTPAGEGWLIISDLAERLGLRSRGELLDLIDDAGLEVAGRLDIRPTHGRAFDENDPLHAARSGEVTSLWRLSLART